MNISLNWLRKYVDFNGSVEELDQLLTNAGISVESIEERGANFPNVVVAQILESTPHPDADRLSVCQVDDGSGHPRQIVCGAKNYRVGDKVPLALPGAVLPGDFKIKVGKLRGVQSEGMMCSAKELRLAEDAQGLLILPPESVVGIPISEVFPADTILELEITPNRPDWLSHLGVAREVAAFTGNALHWEALGEPAVQSAPEQAQIANAANCALYAVRRIRNVRVGPSPAWLREALERIGLRSINNVVDVTNYVMLEMGQPLHAFDAAEVKGGIVVRDAREGEKLAALDGVEYALHTDQLVIADSSGPLALAGIIGGEASSVTGSTTEILLESARFSPQGIRRTGRQFGIYTDSSYRFERGVDPEMVLLASERAVQLILEVAGGEAEVAAVVAGHVGFERHTLTLDHRQANRLLGTEFSAEEISHSLERAGFVSRGGEDARSHWEIPGFRAADVTRSVDLVEEVIRIRGMDQISGRRNACFANFSAADAVYDFSMELRQRLIGNGFFEARTSTLVAAGNEDVAVRLKNPLGEDQACLRSSLLPGLLEALQRNIHRGTEAVALFEIGKVYQSSGEEEQLAVSLVWSGTRQEVSWKDSQPASVDFFDLKGVLSALIGRPGEFVRSEGAWGITADVLIDGRSIGSVGQLSPSAAKALDARHPVLVAELKVRALQDVVRKSLVYSPLPQFPGVTRDLAALVPLSLPYADFTQAIAAVQAEFLSEYQLFDVFTDPTGEKLPKDRKSFAIALTFRSSERTLKAEEVNASLMAVRESLKKAVGADFRE